MKPRMLLWFLGAFAASIALYGLAHRIQGKMVVGPIDSETGQPLLPGFDPAKVRRIEIRHRDTTVALARRGDRWVLESHGNRAVEDGAIENLLRSLSIARIVDVRSLSDANLAVYNLKPEDAVHVSLSEDGRPSPRRFSFGKFSEGLAPTRFDFFARFPDSPRVFLVTDLREYQFGFERLGEERTGAHELRPDRFYVLQVLEVNPPDLLWLEIESGARRLRLAPSGEGFAVLEKAGLPPDFALDALQVRSILYPFELQNLFVAGFYDGPLPPPGLDPPASILRVRRKDGKSWTLSIGSKEIRVREEPFYAMRIEGDPDTRLMNQPQWGRLSRPPEAYGMRPPGPSKPKTAP